MKEPIHSAFKSQEQSQKPAILLALDQEDAFDAAHPLSSLPPFVTYKKARRSADIQKLECRLLRHLRDDHGHVLTPDEIHLLEMQECESWDMKLKDETRTRIEPTPVPSSKHK